MTRVCAKCKDSKDSTNFGKRPKAKSGFDYYCKSCRNSITRDWYKKNTKSQSLRMKTYQEQHAVALKEYREARSEEIKSYNKNYKRNRMQVDPLYKLSCNMRRTTSEFFRGKRTKKTEALLGCSFMALQAHLSSQFQFGMTWDNYGKWHVDHIYPLSLAKSVEELEKLCHYTNLQPLWAIDNLRKGNRVA